MNPIIKKTISKTFYMITLMSIFCGFFLLQACDNNTTNINSNGPEQGKGRVNVHMTDSPAYYDALTINIVRIEIHSSGSDSANDKWQVISDSSQSINIMDLTNGKTKLIGTKDLEPGTYNQLRLILGSGNTVTVNGNSYPIKIPSGQQTGLKININTNINLTQGETTDMLLDFNVAKSVHITGVGQYMMQPVIHTVNTKIDGFIKGQVQPGKAMIFTVTDNDTTSTYADSTSGNFKLVGLKPGTYSLTLLPIDTTYSDTTLTGIQVNSGDTTDVGTIILHQK
jgi:hypothetical protein